MYKGDKWASSRPPGWLSLIVCSTKKSMSSPSLVKYGVVSNRITRILNYCKKKKKQSHYSYVYYLNGAVPGITN